MYKKYIRIIGILLLSGFSFFYTEKVTKIIREKDPIMIKLNKEKDNNYISAIKPIINNDEYIAGINGCEVDIKKSYNKMKTVKEYKKELLVMKEVETKENLKNKYIVSGNKIKKNVSVIFILDNNIDDKLLNYLETKKINVNFFVDLDYLENNTSIINFLSNSNNIYYYGDNNNYNDEYMIYANNLIEMNSKNKSNYCLSKETNNKILKTCSDYGMKTIKTNIISDNIFDNIKTNLSNGAILALKTNDIEKLSVSLNYILYKGYNIVTLDKLLESNNCN